MRDINVDFDRCGFFAKKFLNGYMTANLIEFDTNRYGFIISIFDLSYNFIGSYADYIYSNLDLAIGQANYQFNDFSYQTPTMYEPIDTHREYETTDYIKPPMINTNFNYKNYY